MKMSREEMCHLSELAMNSRIASLASGLMMGVFDEDYVCRERKRLMAEHQERCERFFVEERNG
jgi:hypothetical protein